MSPSEITIIFTPSRKLRESTALQITNMNPKIIKTHQPIQQNKHNTKENVPLGLANFNITSNY